MYLARPHFFWFRMKSFLMPFWLQGVFFPFFFYCLALMEKQGLLTSFSMFMKMGKKNKKPVLMLIICYIKGISRSASCWNLRYHTRGMLPVSTQAPSHCPNCCPKMKRGKENVQHWPCHPHPQAISYLHFTLCFIALLNPSAGQKTNQLKMFYFFTAMIFCVT